MNNEDFMKKAVELVRDYANAHLDKSDGFVIDGKAEFEVYIVWSCKTLQNSKALLSTTLSDGMYYEVTLNGDKKEIYFDAYKKFQNVCHAV